MSYSPTSWVAGVTKLGPTNLNHLEGGVQAAAAVADAALPTPAGSNGQFLKRVGGVWVPTTFGATDIPTNSITQAYMAAGNKVTQSTLAGGPPATPTTGDIWIATGIDSTNTRWTFAYNSASASASKWEFIGGGPAFINTFSATSLVGTATWVYDSTVGSFTAVRAGDYLLQAQGYANTNAANASSISLGFSLNGVPNATTLSQAYQAVGAASVALSFNWIQPFAAGDTVGLGWFATGGTNVQLVYRGLLITPRRIA